MATSRHSIEMKAEIMPHLKSYVRELTKLTECILHTVSDAYPEWKDDLSKDLESIHRLSKAAGLKFFASHLPAVCKRLDKALDNGQFEITGLPFTKRERNRVTPVLFRCLWRAIFDERGSLHVEPNIEAILFLRQLLLLGKKVAVMADDVACEKAVAKFTDIERLLSPRPKGWDGEDIAMGNPVSSCEVHEDPVYLERCSRSSNPERALSLLHKFSMVARLVCVELGDFSPYDQRCKHGPGAIAEVPGSVEKYSEMLRHWDWGLDDVFPFEDFAFANHSSWATYCEQVGEDLPVDEPEVETPWSRLIAVPKTIDKPRLIAAEPVANQFCQQNIWRFFQRRVRASWLSGFITFDDQERNQDLARWSSAGLVECATVDLSDASDRLTCRLVAGAFNHAPRLLKALRAVRTRHCKLPNGVILPLRKYATMGSAVTFPLETLVFLCAALAACLQADGQECTKANLSFYRGDVAVFGDDIVVPKCSLVDLIELLELLELEVNTEKTYSGIGRFRESCGVDAFRGTAVTPVYWRSFNDGRPGSVVSTVDIHNNFYHRGYTWVASYLASTLDRCEASHVPAGSGVFGLHTRIAFDPKTLVKVRWNRALQRVELRMPSIKAKANIVPYEDDRALFQYFLEQPSPLTNWTNGFVHRSRVKMRLQWVSLDELTVN